MGLRPEEDMRRATVSGALAWGRGKPPPESCQSTARMPPTRHAQCRRRAPQSIAGSCAPRRNPLLEQPRSRHQLVDVVVVAVLDARADTATPPGPLPIADPALPEGCHGRRGGPV